MNAGLPGLAAVRASLPGRLPATAPLMRSVMWALLPGTSLSAWLFGGGVLINVLLGVTTALAAEALALRLRRRPVGATLGDGSAALAGWLLALCVSPTLPGWQLVLGVAIAILLAKHVFGGIGHNPFNPAMVGYAVLLISFPQTMNAWPERVLQPLPGLSGSSARQAMGSATGSATGSASGAPDWDALTRQTPLSAWRTARLDGGPGGQGRSEPSVSPGPSAAPRPPGQRPALVAMAWLLGGLWLLARRTIAWQIPLSVLAALALCESVAVVAGATTIGPVAAVFSGGAMLGAFFIATDPVSAAASARGRLVYGAGIGVITFAIRSVGGWPEGIAFGVLLMNGAVPMIDRLSGRAVRSGRTPP